MPNKLIVAFVLAFFLVATYSAIAMGAGGIAATELSEDITATDTTIPVVSTEGFLNADYVFIDGERIRYRSKTNTSFTNCIRDYDLDEDTEADSHEQGQGVYSADADVINSALGYSITSTGATSGKMNVVTLAKNFVTKSIPKMITWDFAIMQEGWLAYACFIFSLLSVGFLITMILLILQALGGVLQSVFRII